jgi:peptidoglycan/xylan/chitin deacetylase (PgdA/CDA1 family)
MKNFFKQHILSFCGSVIGLKRMINSTKENVINVFYHTVSDEYLPHIFPLYKPKNSKEFEQDLDFLLTNFQPISANDVLAHTRKENLIKKPAFHLSFDDGLREIYDVVMPILQRKGIPATVFINSDFVDNKDLFFRYKAALIADKNNAKKTEALLIKYPERNLLDDLAEKLCINFYDFLKKKKPYLTTEQIKTLQQKDFVIGAHSQDHPNYNLIKQTEQIEQTLNSCAFVQKEFKEYNRYFAFPFSVEGVKNSFFEKIQNSVDLTFGTSGINSAHDGKYIDRIDMEIYGKNAKECVYRAYMTNFLKKKLRRIEK